MLVAGKDIDDVDSEADVIEAGVSSMLFVELLMIDVAESNVEPIVKRLTSLLSGQQLPFTSSMNESTISQHRRPPSPAHLLEHSHIGGPVKLKFFAR